MNANDLTSTPSATAPDFVPPLIPLRPKPFSWWLRKFFACNPFYLVSAALLLFGCYRVSLDASFLNLDTARVVFNFTSMQIYEIALVLVAIFLVRRQLWYDSTLLVGLENLLLFVPFIFISYSSLTDARLTQEMCAMGMLTAMLRFGALKKYFRQLNLPGQLLLAGLALLAVNVALPLSYRHFAETKFGVHMDSGPAYVMNECAWLLILPVALALVNLLPRAKSGGSLLPQNRWLPLGMFALWFMVTGVHLYALNYVYDYLLRVELFAPMAWVLAWTLFLRVPVGSVRLKHAVTVPAVAVPLLSASPGGDHVFLALCGLNVAAYVAVGLMDRGNRLARHLGFASALLLLAGLPGDWMRFIAPGFTDFKVLTTGLAAYLLFWSVRLPNPKLAILGSIICGFVIQSVFGHHAGAVHWALQGGFLFLLVHSLRWDDTENPQAGLVRILVALAWSLHCFIWVNADTGRFWMPFIPAAMVLAAYGIYQMRNEHWDKLVLPGAAMLAIISGPSSATVEGVRSAPTGLLAIIASFLLLGLGTVAALTRHHWHRHEAKLETKSSPVGTTTDGL